MRTEWRFPSGPNGERMPSYQVAVGCEVDGENREAALADLRKFMTPAPKREIEAWLAELSVLVAKRPSDEFEESLRIEAYAARLSGYPADVARAALLGRTWKFWPTWDELEKVCHSLESPRRVMIRALERGPEPKEPKRRPPSAAEMARVQAMVDEMFPAVSKGWRDEAVKQAMAGDCMGGAE